MKEKVKLKAELTAIIRKKKYVYATLDGIDVPQVSWEDMSKTARYKITEK